MLKSQFLALATFFIGLNYSLAFQYQTHVYNSDGKPALLGDWLESIEEGDVILVGEKHGFFPHHEMQTHIIQNLIDRGLTVDVGIEHVPYTLQGGLDSYVSEAISESEFLKLLGWSPSRYGSCRDYTANGGLEDLFESTPFDCYIHSLRLSEKNGGKAVAINLPRSLTSKVSRGGVSSLSPEEQLLLPPNYELGSDSYYQRFRELILSFGDSHGPISEDFIQNMFLSQSLWDESMSWRSLLQMNQHPKRVLVVTVGNFHVAHGDGLAARFYARGAKKVYTVSQTFADKANLADIDSMAQPDPVYGAHGDLVLITNIK